VNRLGTTETGNVRWYFLDEQTEIPGAIVPVGYAIAGTEVFLIDESGDRLKHDQVGRICVKSRYLSPGYWKRPDLTRAVFFPDPTGGDERIYVTGDLGRMHPEGCLEFLGRRDSQVKLRGLRIDLQEIEARLAQHAAVKENVVDVIEGENGENRLIGYVVAVRAQILTVSDLRQHLKQALPDYMIPSAFVFLDALPLTPNGKVDRRALPEPDKSRPEIDTAMVQPRTTVEEKLAKLWTELLSIDKIGIYDNFFELGGDSLLAIRLVGEANKRFGKNISVATLLSSPTIAEMASTLSKKTMAAPSPLIAIQPHGSKPPFFCAHGTDCYLNLARYLGPDQPFYGLAQHLEGKRVRHTRIEDIAAYYLREIRTVRPEGPFYIGGHSLGGLIAFEMAQQLRQLGQEVALLVLIDTRSPVVRPLHTSRMFAEHRADDFSRHRVREKLYFLRQRLKRNLGKDVKALACEFYFRTGKPLPPSLQTFYVDQIVYGKIYAEAHRNYVPRSYTGRAVYLKSDEAHDHVDGWNKFAAQGLDVHSVPGDHLTMLDEPQLQSLADTLRQCLIDAQQASGPRRGSGTESQLDHGEAATANRRRTAAMMSR
jgi:thioesterase domain-containing protein/acyl carrier protein